MKYLSAIVIISIAIYSLTITCITGKYLPGYNNPIPHNIQVVDLKQCRYSHNQLMDCTYGLKYEDQYFLYVFDNKVTVGQDTTINIPPLNRKTYFRNLFNFNLNWK